MKLIFLLALLALAAPYLDDFLVAEAALGCGRAVLAGLRARSGAIWRAIVINEAERATNLWCRRLTYCKRCVV